MPGKIKLTPAHNNTYRINMTTSSMSASNKTFPKKKKNLWGRLLTTLFVTLIVLLIVAPIAIKQGLQQWLSGQTQSDVTIAEVRLNLLSGTISLRQLNIPHSSDASPTSSPASSLGYARVTIDWSALLEREVLIKELLLSHAELAIERSGKQLQIAGISLPSASAQKPEQPAKDSSSESALGFTVASLKLEAITLNYRSDDIDTRLEIANTHFANITTTDPDQAVQIMFNLGLDKGQINYQGEVTPFADELTIKGALTITDLDLTPFLALVPQQDFDFNHLSLSMQSSFDGTLPQDAPPRINLAGDATLNGLDIVSTLNDNTFIKTATIELKKINVQYPATVTIDEIVINDLDTSLYQNSDGRLLNSQKPSSGKTTAAAKNDAAEEKKTALAFRLGQLTIQGNSSLLFSDATVTPPFKIKLHPLMLAIGPLDTTQQDAQTPITLTANINEHGSLKLDGHLAPLAKEMKVALNIDLKELELPILSPYTEEHIGYQLRRGRIATETRLTIKGNALNVANKLTLTKLSIKESDKEKAKGLIEQLEMPLDSALDLLRDGNDNIVFDLPIDGSLDDPHFKLGGVMKLAIGKGMKMAAMNYLTTALQPLGTILLAKDIIGVITKPRFKPLTFKAGEAALNENSQAYLEKIGALLKKRPKLALTLCGIANEDDRNALIKEDEATEPQLHTLARARADNARDYLSKRHGINNSQLFKCNPEINNKKGETESTVEGVDIIL